ncbi:alcohol dehydrogenase [Caldisericum exile AZM16c01]|uniref:alcohol dehydrogenase n=2 Tax=Caldisericum exile TaxID=693075 RepID=A0A7U6GFB0_CALEA|nr:alcohol dehydrogenase [Caldisericum exile AZM16c01]
MKAMFIEKIGRLEETSLVLREVEVPTPKDNEVLLKVSYCGVCHTEIDEIEGRRMPKIPVIPGHEVVGYVVEKGKNVTNLEIGDRVGVAWIKHACGKCEYCKSGRENLCNEFVATGADEDGGYAEYMVVESSFAYKLKENLQDETTAPILCAGAVGFRAYKLAEIKDGETVALFGFGASNHIVYRYIRYLNPSSKIIVFVRKLGDNATKLAEELKADYIFETFSDIPIRYDKAIDTTPSGSVIPYALKYLNKGGLVVVNAIRKETPIDAFDFTLIWGERSVKSVANVTREDVENALKLASVIPIVPKVTVFPLEKAQEALLSVKHGKIQGAAVLKIS